MKQFSQWSMVFLFLSYSCFSVQAATLPFSHTSDLFAIESNSGILRITPSADISVFLSIAEIESVIGGGNSGLSDNGVAFDTSGNMYFADDNHLLKHNRATNSLAILASETALATAQGVAVGDSDVDAVTVGDDGFLYVTDDRTDSVLKVDADTGAVSVHVSKAGFLSQTGLEVNLEQGIVTGKNGSIYVASQGGTSADVENEDAIFEIAANGTVSILVSNDQIADPDQFMTTDANGNLVVASDEGETERIFEVDVNNGAVTELISTQALEALLFDNPADVDVRGGLAFDDLGNLFVGDSDEDLIMMFDSSLFGSVFVTKQDILAVTGATNVNLGAGFAFAPDQVPVPAAIGLFCSGLMMLATRKRRPSKMLSHA